MNCEMAQRTIALAALAPANNSPLAPQAAPESAGPDFVTDFFAEHPELAATCPLPESNARREAATEAVLLDSDLPEAERQALEAHLATCRECQAEMAATAAFYRALSLTGRAEPTPSLLARARMRLDATLDSNAHQSALAHLLQQLSFSAGRLRASPGLASALLLVGLAVGGYGGYRAGHAVHADEQRAILDSMPDQATELTSTSTEMAQPSTPLGERRLIADVSGIRRDPDSERVEVHYDRLVPETLDGTLDDPSIRRLLIMALQQDANPLVRNDSLNLLSSECRHRHGCSNGPVLNALLTTLRSDMDPQVRIEALNGLEPYISEDMQVRDAVLRAVMADASPEVRIEAIHLLTPVEVDSSVRHALHAVAAEDGDPSIRDASQRMLNGIPQVQ